MHNTVHESHNTGHAAVSGNQSLQQTRQHREILDGLYRVIQSPAVLSVLSGAPAAGKTALVSALQIRLDPTVRVLRLSGDINSLTELLAHIMTALKLDCPGTGNAIRYQQFLSFLERHYAAGRRLLLVVEDAHRLSLDILDHLRTLADINHSGQVMVQVMLVGQEGLEAMLRLPCLLPLSQRIETHFRLSPCRGSEAGCFEQLRIDFPLAATDRADSGHTPAKTLYPAIKPDELDLVRQLAARARARRQRRMRITKLVTAAAGLAVSGGVILGFWYW